ncbi:helix-turn-helix transcriptional regulator [Deinococcus sp. PESE-38]
MPYDPSLRVLTVLELLQAREEVTGAELSRRLEVSPRTVQRYVARLQDLGIPVEGRRGVGGAYRLKPGFRLPPLMFTGEEALALALGLRALQHLGLSDLLPAAEVAGAKLSRTLPPELRGTVAALEQVAQLSVSPWVASTDARLLTTLFQAAREGLRAELTYRSGAAQHTEREVEVYRVVHVDGRWYAVGHCRLRGALRCFRLDRIEACRLREETFTPPTDFDALAFLQQQLPAAHPYEVSVWLAAPPEHLRGAVSVWHTDLRAEGDGTRMTCQRENLHSFAAFLLGVGVDFRVDSPPELREVLLTLAGRCQQAGEG